MIVSHTHSFVFLGTRKSASSSSRPTLARGCGNQDVIGEDDLLRASGPAPKRHAVPLRTYDVKDWDGLC